MNFLADESVSGPLVRELRQRGHDLKAVRELSPGILDVEVLALADRDRRVLLTFDKGFGELAFRQRLPSSCGIVLFRLNGADPLADNQRALAAIESRTDWAGSFSVITDDRIRMRPSQGT